MLPKASFDRCQEPCMTHENNHENMKLATALWLPSFPRRAETSPGGARCRPPPLCPSPVKVNQHTPAASFFPGSDTQQRTHKDRPWNEGQENPQDQGHGPRAPPFPRSSLQSPGGACAIKADGSKKWQKATHFCPPEGGTHTQESGLGRPRSRGGQLVRPGKRIPGREKQSIHRYGVLTRKGAAASPPLPQIHPPAVQSCFQTYI